MIRDESCYILDFEEIGMKDLSLVGGKNASLGEMMQTLTESGINFPQGFVVTADAYDKIFEDKVFSKNIFKQLDRLDIKNISELERTGLTIRSMIMQKGLPKDVKKEILNAYRNLGQKLQKTNIDVAVRSSATAEDLPEASFAGQQETFLNIHNESDLLEACIKCIASLFTNRAISYRVTNKFNHRKVKISIGIQQMIHSHLASSGVIFTLDTETGADNVILVTSAYGLGENIVAGKVEPDEFMVAKPMLGIAPNPIVRKRLGSKKMRMIYSTKRGETTKNIDVSQQNREIFSIEDSEILKLADWSKKIENYFSIKNNKYTPMDIEWAKDGRSGKLFILQARPETIHGSKKTLVFEKTHLLQTGNILCEGMAVGTSIGSGKVKIIKSTNEINQIKDGDILVTEMTDPDWGPVLKKVGGIITDRGGRTCHAAIVSREQQIPCIVGTGDGTEILKDGQEITMNCAEGEIGIVMEGILPFSKEKLTWPTEKKTRTQIMVNMATPEKAFKVAQMPVDGVGLTRIEFIISEQIKVHPLALIKLNQLQNKKSYQQIISLIKGFESKPDEYFISKLSQGIGVIATAFYPRPVIVRFSDFKSNEYAHLIGGEEFEPKEENPMLGFRGASRYYSPLYQKGFALECEAIKRVRNEMGLKNVKVMIPFCRTPREGKLVIKELANNGLVKGRDNLEVYMMCEIPSNVLDLEYFANFFDGFSIGSNDLTQLTLGVDRDSELLKDFFDERESSVKKMILMAIQKAQECQRPIGICGQAPSDYPEICEFLVNLEIDSISLSPDSVWGALQEILKIESEYSEPESMSTQ